MCVIWNEIVCDPFFMTQISMNKIWAELKLIHKGMILNVNSWALDKSKLIVIEWWEKKKWEHAFQSLLIHLEWKKRN